MNQAGRKASPTGGHMEIVSSVEYTSWESKTGRNAARQRTTSPGNRSTNSFPTVERVSLRNSSENDGKTNPWVELMVVLAVAAGVILWIKG